MVQTGEDAVQGSEGSGGMDWSEEVHGIYHDGSADLGRAVCPCASRWC
jgi:hypothetical protein